MVDQHYLLEAAMEQFQRALQFASPSRPLRLVIRTHNPGGMSGHGTTEVASIAVGFDWEAGRVIIHPAKPLTELIAEQVEAIEKSVRGGGSWHAYEAQKKLRDRALKAEARVAELEQQIKDAGGVGASVSDPGDTSHLNCLEARRISRGYAICEPCNIGQPEGCLYKRTDLVQPAWCPVCLRTVAALCADPTKCTGRDGVKTPSGEHR